MPLNRLEEEEQPEASQEEPSALPPFLFTLGFLIALSYIVVKRPFG